MHYVKINNLIYLTQQKYDSDSGEPLWLYIKPA